MWVGLIPAVSRNGMQFVQMKLQYRYIMFAGQDALPGMVRYLPTDPKL